VMFGEPAAPRLDVLNDWEEMSVSGMRFTEC
jgi:hypothetical protein